jgi:hypothetical protein
MHFPAPVASAWAATIVQFICSLFIAASLFYANQYGAVDVRFERRDPSKPADQSRPTIRLSLYARRYKPRIHGRREIFSRRQISIPDFIKPIKADARNFQQPAFRIR